MQEHPEQSPEGILLAYLSHLGEESVERSCFYHQRDGCALPRAMRSDTCNRFLCPGLIEFRNAISNQTVPRGFVAATEGTSIVSAAFCDESGRHPIPDPAGNLTRQ
jgi:hypothetical protein